MIEHTTEPWFYQEDSDAYTHIVRAKSDPNKIIVSGPQDSKGVAEANARRIVAAVNACAGIGTEYLERFGGTSFNDFKRMKQQRDDLLAACKKAEEWLTGWASAEPYLSIIREAIANAEPKPWPTTNKTAILRRGTKPS